MCTNYQRVWTSFYANFHFCVKCKRDCRFPCIWLQRNFLFMREKVSGLFIRIDGNKLINNHKTRTNLLLNHRNIDICNSLNITNNPWNLMVIIICGKNCGKKVWEWNYKIKPISKATNMKLKTCIVNPLCCDFLHLHCVYTIRPGLLYKINLLSDSLLTIFLMVFYCGFT